MVKRFIKDNKIISVLAGISILVCVSYCLTNNLPDYFGIEAWYSLINNICISYIAATIFYIVQVYKPQIEMEQKSQLAIKTNMRDIYNMLKITAAAFDKYTTINADGGAKIKWDSFTEVERIYLSYSCSKDCANTSLRGLTKDEIIKLDENFKKKVNLIKVSPYSKYFSDSLIELLNELDSFDGYYDLKLLLLLKDTFIGLGSLSRIPSKINIITSKIDKQFGFNRIYYLHDVDSRSKVIIDATKNISQSMSSLEKLNEEIIKREIESQIERTLVTQGIMFDKKMSDEIVKQIINDMQKQRDS